MEPDKNHTVNRLREKKLSRGKPSKCHPSGSKSHRCNKDEAKKKEQEVSDNQLYAGFDRLEYPGDHAMQWL